MNIVADKGDETPEELLARLLRCPKLKATVCKIARSQGVRRDEEEDVYQETMLRMSRATLPALEGEARKYVHGIAKFAAVDHLRAKDEQEVESLEELKETDSPVRERVEQRAFMQGIFKRGYAKFGERFDWFMRRKIHRESVEEIGRAEGFTPNYVRDEVSLMARWFDAAWGKRTGIGSILALLIVVSAGWWLTHRPDLVDESQLSTYAEVRTDDRVVGLSAAALRERGAHAYEAGEWAASEHDLAAARAIDPAAQTPDLDSMELGARIHQMNVEPGGSPDMNAKPPW